MIIARSLFHCCITEICIYSILKSDPTGKTQRGLNTKLLLLMKWTMQ